jgi:hypothetical protein
MVPLPPEQPRQGNQLWKQHHPTPISSSKVKRVPGQQRSGTSTVFPSVICEESLHWQYCESRGASTHHCLSRTKGAAFPQHDRVSSLSKQSHTLQLSQCRDGRPRPSAWSSTSRTHCEFALTASPSPNTHQGHGCATGGVAGMPGICIDGVPGETPTAGVPGISVSGVPGVPGV